MYCVTITTGGTCSGVEGRSSTEGDCTAELWTEEFVEAAGAAPAPELEDKADIIGVLDFGAEESSKVAEESTSDAAAVGNTVVYSVFVTTRRVDGVMVELIEGRAAEPVDSKVGTAGVADIAEDDICVADARLVAVELMEALLKVALP